MPKLCNILRNISRNVRNCRKYSFSRVNNSFASLILTLVVFVGLLGQEQLLQLLRREAVEVGLAEVLEVAQVHRARRFRGRRRLGRGCQRLVDARCLRLRRLIIGRVLRPLTCTGYFLSVAALLSLVRRFILAVLVLVTIVGVVVIIAVTILIVVIISVVIIILVFVVILVIVIFVVFIVFAIDVYTVFVVLVGVATRLCLV